MAFAHQIFSDMRLLRRNLRDGSLCGCRYERLFDILASSRYKKKADPVFCCRWQDLHDLNKFICHCCYTKNGIAAAMPKGHENFAMNYRRWPKPYKFKQSAESLPGPKYSIQSSTVSEKVLRKDAVPSDPCSRAT